MFTSPEQLLALPVEERQTVVILSDPVLREIERRVSSTDSAKDREVEHHASTDEASVLLEFCSVSAVLSVAQRPRSIASLRRY